MVVAVGPAAELAVELAAAAAVAVAEVVPCVELMIDGTVVVDLVGLVPLEHCMGTVAVPCGYPSDFPFGLPSSLDLVALDVAFVGLVVLQERSEYDVVVVAALVVADPSPFAVWLGSSCEVPCGPFPRTFVDTALEPVAAAEIAGILLQLHASCCDVAIVVAVVAVQLTSDDHPFGALPSCCCSAGIRSSGVVGNGSSVVVVVVESARQAALCSDFFSF